MIFARRRYYFWLFRAYIKRWKKTIISSIVGGVIVSLAVIAFVSFYLVPALQKKSHKIGLVGVYTPETIPQNILTYVSYGLTAVDANGQIHGAAAENWEVKNGGKEYIFHLHHGLKFQNGTELTASNVSLNFKDVKKRNINPYTIDFQLKSPYAPFLVSVSRPLFIDNFIGLGKYQLKKLDINAGFIKSITLQDVSDLSLQNTFYFYPTQDSLKLAYVLGDVDEVNGLSETSFKNTNFTSWKNVITKREVNYDELVTLFYNNTDSFLSDKRLRQALNYALPDNFTAGERAYSPLSPKSPYYVKNTEYTFSSVKLAKTELDGIKDLPKKPLVISTTSDFVDTAKIIQNAWKQIGINSEIVIVNGIPNNFQVFLYTFRENQDPDQYSLWHSDGANNIANYRKNVRIDKLLEDGRQTIDFSNRFKIYTDFQKYLLDDVPASFLYFPYEYTLNRK